MLGGPEQRDEACRLEQGDLGEGGGAGAVALQGVGREHGGDLLGAGEPGVGGVGPGGGRPALGGGADRRRGAGLGGRRCGGGHGVLVSSGAVCSDCARGEGPGARRVSPRVRVCRRMTGGRLRTILTIVINSG
ncbi:hypothetical protein C5D34_14020 [Rathayibacter sp. AY1B1]|nr:hypothetical protein C5D34_14020 [Rathayibacter sp. AY1B1]